MTQSWCDTDVPFSECPREVSIICSPFVIIVKYQIFIEMDRISVSSDFTSNWLFISFFLMTGCGYEPAEVVAVVGEIKRERQLDM